jgi:hypothetical protein
VKLEGVIHCDGRACEHHEHVGVPTMLVGRLPAGWVKVIEMGDQDPAEFAFCGWDCLLKRAAEIPPPTFISWQQALGTDEEPS